MLERVDFHNFKALRDASLPLSPFTLLIGPNGSGKTSALQALWLARRPGAGGVERLLSVGCTLPIHVTIEWGTPNEGCTTTTSWGGGATYVCRGADGGEIAGSKPGELLKALAAIRIFNLDAQKIATPITLQPQMTLGDDGSMLAGVIERLRDTEPERFESLNQELSRLLPEFDRILFTIPSGGQKAFQLRTRDGGHPIDATDLSQGTLLALALLTLAYLATPPPLIAVEEPDRGIHPRLLRDVHDALYRLSHPSESDNRDAVQVIATTHSPYMLDLFRDHPEDVVIATKKGNWAGFERLTDQEDIDKILGDSHLGDAWYSGILGGVPLQT